MKKILGILLVTLSLTSCKQSILSEVENPQEVTLQYHVDDSIQPTYKIFTDENGDLLLFDVKKQQTTLKVYNESVIIQAFWSMVVLIIFLLFAILNALTND